MLLVLEVIVCWWWGGLRFLFVGFLYSKRVVCTHALQI